MSTQDISAALLRKRLFWLNLIVIITVAFNLRAPITSIGPMIEHIKIYFSLSSTSAGLLVTLPLIVFGAVSFVVMYFAPILAITSGLLLMILGEIIRSFSDTFGLFLGMVLLGAGIAIANVLLPSFVKEKFPHNVPQAMGIYSFMLSISAIAGIALSLPLLAIFPLPKAMLFWVVFALIALVAYIPHIRNKRILRPKKRLRNSINLFTCKTAWIITGFMGLQSFASYSVFTWLPSMVAQKGYTQEFGAYILLISQIVALCFSLFAPILMGKLRQHYKTPYIVLLCSCYVIAFALLLLFDSVFWIYMAGIILGAPLGGVFGIALLFISIKTQNSFVATKLSSMSQGCGYLLASFAPFLIGYLHDQFHSFTQSLIILLIISCLISIFGLLAHKLPIIRMSA